MEEAHKQVEGANSHGGGTQASGGHAGAQASGGQRDWCSPVPSSVAHEWAAGKEISPLWSSGRQGGPALPLQLGSQAGGEKRGGHVPMKQISAQAGRRRRRLSGRRGVGGKRRRGNRRGVWMIVTGERKGTILEEGVNFAPNSDDSESEDDDIVFIPDSDEDNRNEDLDSGDVLFVPNSQPQPEGLFSQSNETLFVSESKALPGCLLSESDLQPVPESEPLSDGLLSKADMQPCGGSGGRVQWQRDGVEDVAVADDDSM